MEVVERDPADIRQSLNIPSNPEPEPPPKLSIQMHLEDYIPAKVETATVEILQVDADGILATSSNNRNVTVTYGGFSFTVQGVLSDPFALERSL